MNIPQFTISQNDMLYNDQLSQALVGGLSDSGWTSPQQTTEQITTSASEMPYGTFWYNSDLNKLQVNTPTGVQTISSS